MAESLLYVKALSHKNLCQDADYDFGLLVPEANPEALSVQAPEHHFVFVESHSEAFAADADNGSILGVPYLPEWSVRLWVLFVGHIPNIAETMLSVKA